LLFLLAWPLAAQCNYVHVASDPFRATVFDLAVDGNDGNDLWAATGYGVGLYDRSVDPPRLTALMALPQTTRVVRAGGGVAYAASGDSLAVVRRNGKLLEVVSTITAPGAVIDLLLTANNLYAATHNGIAQYDLIDRTHPTRTSATFATSNAAVTSLALLGSTLYAADGDTSVEAFDVTIPAAPAALTPITSQLRAATLHGLGNRLYVGDGLRSEVFVGGSGAAILGVPTTTFAAINTSTFFAGGDDRRVRAFDDLTLANPIELYRHEVPATAGNVNRVTALVIAGGRLYAGAGDAGIVSYDIANFTPPFALRSYTADATPTSVVSTGDHLFTSGATGGIQEYTQNSGGQLTKARSWDAAHVSVVRDSGTGLLLTTSGASATLWTLTSSTPVSISQTTFRANVAAAVLAGTTATALLTDGSLFTADMAQEAPAPQPLVLAGAGKLSGLARFGSARLFVQQNDDPTSTLFYLPSTATTPVTATVSGIPIANIALGGSTAAVFTFRGINVIDFSAATPAPRVLPGSNSALPLGLAVTGNSVLQLTSSELIAWPLAGAGAPARYPLAGAPVALTVGGDVAAVATSSGVSTVVLTSSSQLPVPTIAPNGNEFHRKVVAGAGRIYLFDGHAVDVLTSGLQFVTSVTGGIIDVAASDAGFYTLSGGSVVTRYSPAGVPLGSTTVATGDVQPQAIFTAGDTLWVSFSRGCLTATCEKVTLVLDAATLAQSDSLPGGAVDVTTNGGSVFAIFDMPSEVRAYAGGAHPSLLASRATEGSKTPVSIAADDQLVTVLGERLYTYTRAALTLVQTQLDPFLGLSGANAYTDQRVRLDSGCLAVAGRGPTTITPTTILLPARTYDAPSFVRSMASVPGTIYLLTDYSLEVLSTSPLPQPPRRRAATH
jgi:hypothetical protein